MIQFFDDLIREDEEDNSDVFNSKHTEEEINQMSTDENLSEINRALYLIKTGKFSQKQYVLKNLPRYMYENDAQYKFIPFLVSYVKNWDTSLQEEFTDQLPACADMLETKQCHALVKVWIEQIKDTENEIWANLICGLCKHCESKMIQKHLIPFILKFGEFNQPHENKSIAARVIGSSAISLGEDFEGQILDKARNFSQDTDWRIRKDMWQQWALIVQFASQAVNEDIIWEEALQLLQDDEIEVRVESVQLMAEIIPSYSEDFARDKIIPAIQTHIFQAEDQRIDRQIIAKSGIFMVNLKKFSDCENLLSDWQSMMKRVLNYSHVEQFVDDIAYNFPAIASWSEREHFPFDLLRLLQKHEGTHNTVAQYIHEIVFILNEKNNDVEDMVFSLLENPDHRTRILPRLPSILPFLYKQEKVLEILVDQLKTGNYRKKLSSLQCLLDTLKFWNIGKVLDNIVPLCLKYSACMVWNLKVACVKLLARALEISHFSDRNFDLCEKICNEIGQNTKYINRMLFIEFWKEFQPLVSSQYFSQTFLTLFINLAEDPVVDVRMKFTQAISAIRPLLLFEDANTLNLKHMKLVNDEQPMVAGYAADAQFDCMNQILDIQGLAKENDRKIAAEEAKTEKEAVEKEEAKHRNIEELANKAKAAFASKQNTFKSNSYKSSFNNSSNRNKNGRGTIPGKVDAPFTRHNRRQTIEIAQIPKPKKNKRTLLKRNSIEVDETGASKLK